MKGDLVDAVRTAVERAPGRPSELAREAGLHQTTLSGIQRGVHGTTPETAQALADALVRWATRCLEGADGIRRVLLRVEDPSPRKEDVR